MNEGIQPGLLQPLNGRAGFYNMMFTFYTKLEHTVICLIFKEFAKLQSIGGGCEYRGFESKHSETLGPRLLGATEPSRCRDL